MVSMLFYKAYGPHFSRYYCPAFSKLYIEGERIIKYIALGKKGGEEVTVNHVGASVHSMPLGLSKHIAAY